MQNFEPQDLEDGLERLDEFLLSERVGDDAMTLSTLDGFLTGIAIGPELVMPSEWLPLVWGEQHPSFKDDQEAQEFIGLIMARYNQILFELSNEGDAYEPILMMDNTQALLGEIWAEGFVQAMSLRKPSWEKIFDSEYGTAAGLIMALVYPEMMDELCDSGEDAAIIADAISEELPITVKAIDQYWKSQRSLTETLSSIPKVGRNAPCPCGSGKKYKKCCLN